MTKLICGDSLIELKKIKSKSVDLIFSDPPYFLSNDGYSVSAGKRVTVNKGLWDKSKGFKENLKFHKTWIKECKRILKDEGSIWISGTYHSIYQCGFILQSVGFEIMNDVCWFKPNGAPNIGCRNFTASHETLIWAKKSKKAKHIFNYKAMKNHNDKRDAIKHDDKQMRSVWWISNTPSSEKKFGKHTTQKPIELLTRIILSSSDENCLVLDPFCGSGTTGVICARYNRHFIGIDNSKEYIELSRKRIDGESNE